METHGDGVVCVTLFVPAAPQLAQSAALEMARHMGLANPEVINARLMHEEDVVLLGDMNFADGARLELGDIDVYAHELRW